MEGVTVIADPFPHAVVDGMWDVDLLGKVANEFPDGDDLRWRRYHNDLEGKLEGGTDMWGSATRLMFDRLADTNFCRSLEVLFGIDDLAMQTIGGGYHLIPPGGKLGVHADFNRGDGGLYRRLNLLIYLNDGWTRGDGGELELWDGVECAERILPVFNRTVIFATSSTSFHGHPHPLPGPKWRKSLACYYFAPTPAPGYTSDHSTVFR
jgi:2OG-Fe(II) oxygenase superfamily